jgi:acyl-[acyl carrier protein]--UDP-N-acetylglucosamine O-acyltransferase
MTLIDTATITTPPVEQLGAMLDIKKPRIQKHDFKDGMGRVPAKRHVNGRGWVAQTAVVEDSVYVGPQCKVFENAYLSGKVKLEGKARVCGRATISGHAIIKQNAFVSGKACVTDVAIIGENARISGYAVVSGTSRVFGSATITDNAQVISSTFRDNPVIAGRVVVIRSGFSGNSRADDQCTIIDATVDGFVHVSGHSQLLRRTAIHNSHPNERVSITGHAILTEETTIWSPIVIQQNAILVRCRINTATRHEDNHRPEISGTLVLQNRHFSSRQILETALSEARNPRPAPVAPNIPQYQAQPVQGFPVRQVNYLAVTPGPRRVQRLQEAST